MEGTVSGAVLAMTSEVCVCVSLVLRCSNIQVDRYTVYSVPGIYSSHMHEKLQESVSKCICELFESHGRSSIWSEFLGLKWLSKQSRII